MRNPKAAIAVKHPPIDPAEGPNSHCRDKSKAIPAALKTRAEQGPLVWQLALDELGPTGRDVRPHLASDGRASMPAAKGRPAAAAKPLALKLLDLDPLSVIGDDDFLDLIDRERNLSDFVKEGLPALN